MSKAIKVQLQDFSGFAVAPIEDCPHAEAGQDAVALLRQHFIQHSTVTLHNTCSTCQSAQQNWICVGCLKVYCSQYVKGHMKEHSEKQKHGLVMSLRDGSIWCYECDSYVTNKQLSWLAKTFSDCKFGDEQAQALQKLQKLALKTPLEQITQKIKSKHFKKIVFLTGAGISVKAGIPDFRTPGTGIYSQLSSYNLPTPQAVFNIQFFKKNPAPFYKLSKQFLSSQAKPVSSHKLIQLLHQRGQLLHCITQNIDGLEIQAGLPLEKLTQAHGHMRTAHCLLCVKQFAMQMFKQAVEEQKYLRCQCGGLVKPDIVFFGQQLPPSFRDSIAYVQDCDLCLVMGTSLKVFPFAMLTELLPKESTVVLINREEVLKGKAVSILGDIDQTVDAILKGLNS